MARLLCWALIGSGFAMLAVSAFWSWAKALEESAEEGVWFLWQPYAFYYLVSRWPKMKRPFALGLIGMGLMIAGALIGAAH